MDNLPPDLRSRRHEIHDKVFRRARALRRRRASAIIIAVAIVVVVPVTAIALTAGRDSHASSRIAISEAPTTRPATSSSPETTTSSTRATTTTRPSTSSSTEATTSVTGGDTTTPGCHNSTSPACGQLYYDPPITNQPASVSVTVSPKSPTIGQTVTFTLHARDPDSNLDSTATWCNDRGYTFGDGIESRCAVACASRGYGRWDPPPARPSDVTLTLEHTYSKPGTYHSTFTISAEPCGPRTSAASAVASVTIAPATPSS